MLTKLPDPVEGRMRFFLIHMESTKPVSVDRTHINDYVDSSMLNLELSPLSLNIPSINST